MTTKQETGNRVGQRVAARINLGIKVNGARVRTIDKGTQGTIVSDNVGSDGVAQVRVRWDGADKRTLRLASERYERALTEIDN